MQVILNLLNNSYDALESLNEKWIEIKLQKNNNKIVISVTDSGEGIPNNISHKIFEPFFTTKEIGKGPGLGLCISKGIIEGYKGNLYLDKSSFNKCFIIELPLN